MGLLDSLIAPYLQGAGGMSQYGGAGNLGAALLAQSGPSMMPQTTAQRLGLALQAAQTNGLQQALARSQLANQGLGLMEAQIRFPLQMEALRRGIQMYGGQSQGGASGMQPQGVGSPQGAATGQASAAPQSTPTGASPAIPAASVGAPGSPFQDYMNKANMGAMFGLAGMPQPGMIQAATAGMKYDPQVNTANAIAKNQITQDENQLYSAYASGNPQLIQGLTTKLRTDLGQLHVGSMSGIQTRQNPDGSWTTINPSTGLVTNTRTGSQFMPGAVQAFAERAGAESGAERAAQLGAETSPVGGYGSGYGGGGGASGIPQRPMPTQNAPAQNAPAGWEAVQTPGYVPPVLQSSGHTNVAPGNTGAGEQVAFQKGQANSATTTLETLNTGADSAQLLLTQAQEVDDAATQFSPERFASIRGELLSALQPLGVLSDKQVSALGSYQNAAKMQIQMQTMLTKTLGSREAAQVFDKLGKGVPSLNLSPQGLSMISSYTRGVARWKIAQNTYGQRLAAQQNVAGINNLQSTFETKSNPAFYILASMPAQMRATVIARSPNPKGLLREWQQASLSGLAPGPNDYEGQ